MGTTQPIRNRQELQDFSSYYKQVKPHLRNHALVVLGLNTALRISDLLNLRWKNVYDFKRIVFAIIFWYGNIKQEKEIVLQSIRMPKSAVSVFHGENPCSGRICFSKRTNPYKPLSRSQAYRIIKEDAAHTTSEESISCHSLRKTFGYYAWQEGISQHF